MKRLYIILFYALLIVFRSVAYPGFTGGVLGLKEKVLNRFILRDSSRGFRLLSRTISVYFKSGAGLIGSSMTEYGWFDRLLKDGIIRGVYVRDGMRSFTVGTMFIPQFERQSHYYIDKDGRIHYTDSQPRRSVFIDAIIDASALREDIVKLDRVPDWVVLFDFNGGTYTVLFQRQTAEMTFDPAGFSDAFSTADLRHRSVRFAGKFDLEGGTFYLVARYPLVFGADSVFLIGLIVLLILTILLLIFIIHFILSSLKQRSEYGSPVSEKNDVNSDVVNQIDDALLRSGELRVSIKIQEEKPVVIQVEKSDQKLIRDGIRIKKQEKGVL